MIRAESMRDFDPRLAPQPENARQWGVPLRWWDESAYAGHEAWDTDRWHWEFLRRDQDYRRAFDEAVATRGSPVSADCDSFDGQSRFSEAEREALIHAGLTYWPFEASAALVFTLDQFFDPRISDWLGHGPQWSGLRVLPQSRPAPTDAVNTTMAFDLTMPLVPQLKRAREILQADQAAAIKLLRGLGVEDRDLPTRGATKRPDKWPTYLRVLDAKNVIASHATVGEVLGLNGDHKSKAAKLADQAQGVWRSLAAHKAGL